MTDADRIRRSLCDIVEQGKVAGRLVARGRSAYDDDEILRFAAESIIIHAGESVARIDAADRDFVAKHPDLELRAIRDSRNVIAHGYDIIDVDVVWEILAGDLPRIAGRVAVYLERKG